MAIEYGGGEFILNLPDGWADETIYSFRGPEVSGVAHNLLVTVDRNPDIDDLERYATARIAILEDNLSGAEVLKHEPRQLKNGYLAYEAVIKWIPTEGAVLWQKQVWVLGGEFVYNFVASFSKKTFKTVRLEVEQIIESFVAAATMEADPSENRKGGLGGIVASVKKKVSGKSAAKSMNTPKTPKTNMPKGTIKQPKMPRGPNPTSAAKVKVKPKAPKPRKP